jgi:hypothetical protein
MAFQTGTRVDPRLGALDFSGFTNAANIQAQSLANLGQTIGSGIQKYQENKAITSAALASLEGATAADPAVLTALQNAPEDIAKAYKNLQENPNKKDALMISGYVNAFTDTKSKMAERAMAAREAEMEEARLKMEQDKSAVEIEKIKAQTEKIGKMTTKERIEALSMEVDETSFADYLSILQDPLITEIKDGEIIRGRFGPAFAFDKDQVAAFDNIIRANPEFLEDMPQVVKDYYLTSNVPTQTIDLPGGGKAVVTPQ